MKLFHSFVFVFSIIILAPVRAEYIFAPLPTESESQSILKSKAFTNELSALLGKPVTTRYYQSYDKILEAFAKGEVDFVELGPFNYLKLKKMTREYAPLSFVPQLKNQKFYRCHLVTAMDNTFQPGELGAVKAPKIALTQPLSTCGWFGMDYFFQQEGLDLRHYNYDFVGSHEGVALSVLRLEHDLGSVANFISERYQPLGLEVIASSPDLPLFVLVANSNRVSSEQQQQIQQHLSGLTEQKTAHWGFGKYGFLPYRKDIVERFEKMVAKMRPLPEN